MGNCCDFSFPRNNNLIDRQKDSTFACFGLGLVAHAEQPRADNTSEGNDELAFVLFPIEPEITGLSIVRKKQRKQKERRKKSNNMV